MSKTWRIYILALLSFLVGTSEYIIAGILDKISDSMHISLVAAGQLITVFSLVYALGTPIIMAFTSGWNRKKLLLYALGLFILANILAFIMPGFGLFVSARVLMALGAGVVVVTSLSIAAMIAPSGRQASAIATVIMGFTASLIVGVPLGRMVATAYDWKVVFGGIGALGLLAIVVIALTIPALQSEAAIPLRKQLALLKNPKMAMVLAVSFFWLGGYSIAYTYISPYLLSITGMSEKTLSTALFAFGIASLVGSQLGGFSADRWGVQRTLRSGMLLHMITLILLTLAAHSPSVVFLLLLLWSFSAWSSGPAQQYNLVTLAPESAGIMLSLNSSVMQLAMAAGAGIGGVVVSQISLTAVTWMGAIGVGIAFVIMILSSRRSTVAAKPVTTVSSQRV
ncbi:MFS transporter [Paenibacillus alba]|uniref:MFS transporter n=1 Tax=Paenibacillus alba TaxID=1197127 RepID=A0ABU6FW08_9BACL|nr:MFS transporter [Paenibacillus alba]MEC0226057.1 MFS transporter [Paenibacillus alba]